MKQLEQCTSFLYMAVRRREITSRQHGPCEAVAAATEKHKHKQFENQTALLVFPIDPYSFEIGVNKNGAKPTHIQSPQSLPPPLLRSAD